MSRSLYHFVACPYCEKTRRALRFKGLDWESHEVPPDDRTDVVTASAQEKVPVLVDGGAVVVDSTAIFSYLEDTYPDPPLYPADTRERALAEVMDEFGDGPLHDAASDTFRGIMNDERNTTAEQDLQRYLESLNTLLQGRDYLFGDQSLADMSVYAHLRIMLMHPDMPKGEDFPDFRAWVDRMQAQGV